MRGFSWPGRQRQPPLALRAVGFHDGASGEAGALTYSHSGQTCYFLVTIFHRSFCGAQILRDMDDANQWLLTETLAF
eukprot:5451200-Pleurochrysis_carterae.AAC.2